MKIVSSNMRSSLGETPSRSLRVPLALVDLIDILLCPVCRNRLRSIGSGLVCSGPIPHRFPIVDGVPVLINASNSVFCIQDFVERRNTFYSKGIGWKTQVARWVPSLSKNLVSKRNYRKLSELLGAESHKSTVLVIGGAVDGDGIAPLYAGNVRVISCDASFGPRTNLICDGHDLPFGERTFDACVA